MAKGFSARELQKMRDVQLVFMPDLADVLRPTKVKAANGGHTSTYVEVYSDLPCEATPKVLRQIIEHVVGGGIASAVRWNVTLPYGTQIHLDDRIRVTSAQSGDVAVYEVNGDQSTESYETAVTAQCLKVE